MIFLAFNYKEKTQVKWINYIIIRHSHLFILSILYFFDKSKIQSKILLLISMFFVILSYYWLKKSDDDVFLKKIKILTIIDIIIFVVFLGLIVNQLIKTI